MKSNFYYFLSICFLLLGCILGGIVATTLYISLACIVIGLLLVISVALDEFEDKIIARFNLALIHKEIERRRNYGKNGQTKKSARK